jgi:hypothetical protein
MSYGDRPSQASLAMRLPGHPGTAVSVFAVVLCH